MRILQVLDSLRVGGSESLAATLATAMAEKGHTSVLCGLGQDGPLRTRLEHTDIPCLHLDRAAGIDLLAMALLGKTILRYRCSVVMTHHFRQLVHALPAATAMHRRLVHVEHDCHSYENRSDLLQKLRLFAPFVSAFVFVSEEIREWFVDRVPCITRKSLAIPNGVDTQRFCPDSISRQRLRASLGIRDEDFVVGTCARLEPVKGLDLLLQGVNRLPRDVLGGSVHLIVVGDGSLRSELERMALDGGMEDRTHFVGVIDEVPSWLNAFDAYALTSMHEGLPLSLMEAMSTGLPVVAANVGSISKVVDAEVGVLLHERSAEALEKALHALAQNRELAKALGETGRQRIVTAHSLEGMEKRYMDTITGSN